MDNSVQMPDLRPSLRPGESPAAGSAQATDHRDAYTVSVIIPTYNERTTLPVLVKRLALLRDGVSLELVIVDDGSPDGTGVLADALATEGLLPMTVVHRSGKGGLASAILAGAGAAHAPIVAVMDSDLSHPPEFLPTLLAALTNEVDIAIASRYMPGGGIDQWPLYRRAVSLAATKLVQIVLGVHVHDPVSGFFAVRRTLLLDQPYAAMGYKILTEILARHPNSRVVEVPYRFTDRQGGASKLSSTEITTFARLIWRLRRSR